jgi:hypothetical protein
MPPALVIAAARARIGRALIVALLVSRLAIAPLPTVVRLIVLAPIGTPGIAAGRRIWAETAPVDKVASARFRAVPPRSFPPSLGKVCA